MRLPTMVNYYEVLGVAHNSTPQEIKRSFRRKAKEIHPDVRQAEDPSSDDEMRLLLAAYGVLSDIQKRLEYDKALRSFLSLRGFDYRDFLRRQADPFSHSKLIFHDLLTNHEQDAIELYERLASSGFVLERYLSREDFMDCAFLLAEAFEGRRQFRKAYVLYKTLYVYETEKPYFRHFTEEVVDRLRVLLCFKMMGELAPSEAIDRLHELIRFDFSRKDNAFFYKKLAETYAAMGLQDTAVEALRKGLDLDSKLPGVKKLRERIGCSICLDNP